MAGIDDLYVFSPNTKIKSSQVNFNFEQVKDEVNTYSGTLDTHNTQINNLNTTVSGHTTSINSLNTTVAGHTTSIEALEDDVATLAKASPVGLIIWYASDNVPDGYLVCDGSAVSRTDYADLFAIIGTTFGAGDSTTTFNLPDLIDQFIQGSTTVGTVKEAGLPNITGSTSWYQTDYDSRGGGSTGCFTAQTASGGTDGYDDRDTCGRNHFDASLSSSIYGNSDTVQPPSLTLLPCIKY